MSTFRILLLSALVAGLFTGTVVALVDITNTVPLILRAEVFEEASAPAGMSEANEITEGNHHHADAAGATPEYRRNGFTVVAMALAYVGYALVLVSISEFFGGLGSWRVGVIWGLAGFTVFSLAPAIGLPPELPAMPAAELASRQLWWAGTALCTAIALGIVAKTRNPRAVVLAIAVFALPHVIGAPQPQDHATAIPYDLYKEFVQTTLAVNLAGWLVLGAVLGWVRPLFRNRPRFLRALA